MSLKVIETGAIQKLSIVTIAVSVAVYEIFIWFGYRMVKKLRQDVKPFSSNTATSRTDGQTDGETDRQTDRQICYINIARQCADAR